MSRPARPLDTAAADRLCAAAAAAFAARGLDGASLNGILSRARIGKSSFYHRFANKAALHDWVTERLSTALLNEIHPPQPHAFTTQDFRDELAALLARLGHVALTRPELLDLGRMFHNSADTPPERAITRVRLAVNRWIADVLESGQRLGSIRTDLPLDLLTAWAIATLTTIDKWALGIENRTESRHEAATTALNIFWNLITGE
jgi:AcrR family transcriptional regulator